MGQHTNLDCILGRVRADVLHITPRDWHAILIEAIKTCLPTLKKMRDFMSLHDLLKERPIICETIYRRYAVNFDSSITKKISGLPRTGADDKYFVLVKSRGPIVRPPNGTITQDCLILTLKGQLFICRTAFERGTTVSTDIGTTTTLNLLQVRFFKVTTTKIEPRVVKRALDKLYSVLFEAANKAKKNFLARRKRERRLRGIMKRVGIYMSQ